MSFPSFSSFQGIQSISGSGEDSKQKLIKEKSSSHERKKKSKKKKLENLILNNYLEEEVVVDEEQYYYQDTKGNRIDTKGNRISHAPPDLGGGIDSLSRPRDYYIDIQGDWKNLKTINLNQPIPLYKPPKPWRYFGKNTHIQRYKNYWVVNSETLSKRMPYSELNLFKNHLVRLTGHRELEASKPTDYIKLPGEEFEEMQEDLIDYKSNISIDYKSNIPGSTEFQQKSIQADRLIQKNPSCVENWINFINLQDELKAGLVSVPTSLKNVIQSKKMAIVEKAMDEIPDAEELQSIYLDLKSVELDSRQMLELWDSVLAKHPTSFLLRKNYLDFRLSNSTSFSLQSVLEVFEDFLDNISKLNINTIDRDEKVVYIIQRLCSFLKSMGYMERGVAIYQALLELNCFSPSSMGWLERVGLFEEFWENEYPRFGDDGAQGWTQTVAIPGDVHDSLIDTSQFSHIQDHFLKWGKEESYLSLNQWWPVRNSIQDDIEDPYQTVVFEDIDPFLVMLKSESGKKMLLHSFFQFIGVPSLVMVTKSSSMFNQDSFLHQEIDNQAMCNLFLNRSDTASDDSIPLSFPIQFYPFSVEGLFGDSSSWPCCLEQNTLGLVESCHRGVISFVSKCLEQSTKFVHTNSLYLLWIQGLSDSLNAEKAGKKMLKGDPMNLALWNVYAQLVYKLKGAEEARKIYYKVLSMYHAFPPSHQIGVSAIYFQLALIEWTSLRSSAVISCLVAFAEKKPLNSQHLPSIDRINSAKTVLVEAVFDEFELFRGKGDAVQNKHSEEMETLLYLVKNAASLHYFTQDQNGQVIVDLYTKAIEFSAPQSLFRERLYQMQVELLVLAMKSQFKPVLLRNVLEAGLIEFPTNTLLLGVYGMTEGKSRLDARMRRFLNDHIHRSPSHILHLFSIWTEIHQTNSPNPAIIKSRIQSATQSQPTNPTLWILAMTYEENPGKQKQLFYQAIANCPFSKAIYLLAFNELRSCFTMEELEDIYGIMDDKEIRIMHSLGD